MTYADVVDLKNFMDEMDWHPRIYYNNNLIALCWRDFSKTYYADNLKVTKENVEKFKKWYNGGR